jgi:hypothetical protein
MAGKVPMSKKKAIKTMANAKKALCLSINIGKINYKFNSDIFDLSSRSIPFLSDQIADIPGHVAFVIEAHGEAEKVLAKAITSFDVYIAKEFSKMKESDRKKTEVAKGNILKGKKSEEYLERADEITELRKLVRILDAYRKGIDAKLQLAQTLSANLRTERESYRRDYNKEGGVGRKLGK